MTSLYFHQKQHLFIFYVPKYINILCAPWPLFSVIIFMQSYFFKGSFYALHWIILLHICLCIILVVHCVFCTKSYLVLCCIWSDCDTLCLFVHFLCCVDFHHVITIILCIRHIISYHHIVCFGLVINQLFVSISSILLFLIPPCNVLSYLVWSGLIWYFTAILLCQFPLQNF